MAMSASLSVFPNYMDTEDNRSAYREGMGFMRFKVITLCIFVAL